VKGDEMMRVRRDEEKSWSRCRETEGKVNVKLRKVKV
jgi:hypothetical protein